MVTSFTTASCWVAAVCVCVVITRLQRHTWKTVSHSDFFFFPNCVNGYESERRREKPLCLHLCPRNLLRPRCAHGRHERFSTTKRNKCWWIVHHSATTGISINIRQWRRSSAEGSWTVATCHSLFGLSLQVGFRECGARGAPGGKTQICLTLLSSRKITHAELCVFWPGYAALAETPYRNFNQANQSQLNVTREAVGGGIKSTHLTTLMDLARAIILVLLTDLRIRRRLISRTKRNYWHTEVTVWYLCCYFTIFPLKYNKMKLISVTKIIKYSLLCIFVHQRHVNSDMEKTCPRGSLLIWWCIVCKNILLPVFLSAYWSVW